MNTYLPVHIVWETQEATRWLLHYTQKGEPLHIGVLGNYMWVDTLASGFGGTPNIGVDISFYSFGRIRDITMKNGSVIYFESDFDRMRGRVLDAVIAQYVHIRLSVTKLPVLLKPRLANVR